MTEIHVYTASVASQPHGPAESRLAFEVSLTTEQTARDNAKSFVTGFFLLFLQQLFLLFVKPEWWLSQLYT